MPFNLVQTNPKSHPYEKIQFMNSWKSISCFYSNLKYGEFTSTWQNMYEMKMWIHRFILSSRVALLSWQFVLRKYITHCVSGWIWTRQFRFSPRNSLYLDCKTQIGSIWALKQNMVKHTKMKESELKRSCSRKNWICSPHSILRLMSPFPM